MELILYSSLLKARYVKSALRNLCTQALDFEKPSSHNNFNLTPRFVNRNPRNLEQMLLARKPTGWEWDRPSRTFWYRLEIQLSSKNVFAKVVHNSGSRVTEVSTTEWGIKKQLMSTADSDAAFTVGRVLARRCFEAGVVAIHVELPDDLKGSKKAQSLLTGLTKEGMALEEPGDLDEIEERPCATMYR